MSTVSVILSSYRRTENIPHMVERVKNQTVQPERIIVWNNNATDDGKDIVLPDYPDVEIINTNSNEWYLHGAFSAGYLLKSDYIAQMDDDMPPGPEWLEWCIKKQEETPGIYTRRGLILESGRAYRPNKAYKSQVGKGELIQVDMVSQTIFMPAHATSCMTWERPSTYRAGCDIHFSYTCQKYGNYKIYVPYPEKEEQLPLYKPEELPKGESDHAMWQRNDHFIIKDVFVRRAVRNGWKLLNEKSK